MQNGNQIITIILMVVAVIIAIFLGSAIGSEDQTTPAIFIASAVALTLALKLGPNAWMVLPVFWFWTGKIHVLPIPFNVRNLATFFVLVVLGISLAIGRSKFRSRLGFLDLMVVLIAIDIGVIFALNPVGLSALSSGTVGARPYFEIGLALLVYFVLSNQDMTPQQSRLLPKLVVASALVLCLGKVLAAKTALGYTLWFFYTDWAPTLEGIADPASLMPSVGRISLYTELSGAILLYIFSMGNPFAVLNPLRFVRFASFVVAMLGIFLSGFRSLLVLYGLAFASATFVWARFRGLFTGMFLGIVGLAFMIAVNEISPLPLSIQRSLSFLPGNWDSLAMRDAEGSSKWRFEMWERALFTDEVIKNKVLGDGFGFKSREIDLLRTAQMGGSAGAYDTAFHEHMLLVGGFHSGPISTIRFVGYVGLAIYYVMMIGLAIVFYRTMRDAADTPYAFGAKFFGLTWVCYPIYFTVIFGAFDADLPTLFYGAGMCKLLQNSLRSYRQESVESSETAQASRVD